MEDLYAILGVSRSSTQDEIKAAYRKLARTCHPDVNKSPDAEKQFANLQRAYEVLSSEDKRRRYDRTGRTDGNANPFGGHGVGADDMGEMFETFFRGRGGRTDGGHRPPPRNLDIRAPLSLDLETIAIGGTIKTRTISGDVVDVNVPPAVSTGATLRVKGKGERDAATGRQGDLLLEIRAKPHATITRGTPSKPDPASLDLTTRVDISITDATLGGPVRVQRLDQSLTLTVPPATPSGRALRLRGKGLTNAAGNSGDLYVELRIVPPDPETLTPEQTAALERIRQAESEQAAPDS